MSPAYRLAARLDDARQRAEAARALGDRDGAAYAEAEARAILRQLRRLAR